MSLSSLAVEREWFLGSVRPFSQPIKSDDHCVGCYTMHKREATEYDSAHAKKYGGDLNTTLIFVCCSRSCEFGRVDDRP
jgi:hypothetical protein